MALSENAEWCRRYIVGHCIERSSPARPITGLNGKRNAWQLFLRRALYDAQFVQKAGALMCDTMQSEFAGSEYQIAGMESGAVPLLIVLGQEFLKRGLPINVFSVRKEPKPYGIHNQIEGAPQPGKQTILVDDFVHSGAALEKCRKVLRAEGVSLLNHSFCLVDSGRVNSVVVHGLFSLADLGLKD